MTDPEFSLKPQSWRKPGFGAKVPELTLFPR